MPESKIMFSWMNALNIIAGCSFITISVITLIDFNLAAVTILILFGITLLIVGLVRIIIGYYNKKQTKTIRILKLITGIAIVVISIVELSMVRTLGIDVLAILIASAMILNGIIRVIMGIINKEVKLWLKIVFIIIGLTTIFFGVLVFFFYQYGFFTIVVLLALIFIFSGFTRIMYAVQAG